MAQRQNNDLEGIQRCAKGANREFRKIPSLKYLYEVNGDGTIVRNAKSKRQLKIELDMHHSDKGYYATFVHIGGRSKNQCTKRLMIHRLVAECWLGPCPEGYQVDHIDRDPHNNDWRNLRYVTHSEQVKNRDPTGISARGKANLERARQMRAKPVTARKDGHTWHFASISECARWLARTEDASYERMRYRLRAKRRLILGYQMSYGKSLNEETGHDDPTG